MTGQTLYRVGTHHGVTVLLTSDAYQAFRQTMLHFDATNGSYDGIDPTLEPRIAAGTMTFVKTELWEEGNTHYRVIHTGTYEDMDMVQRLNNVIRDESRTFSVPFSNGHFPTFQRELEKGFGPKPSLFDVLVHNHELPPVEGEIG